ncbi:hypothetical protein [Vibrio vulnificus]|uniref:hypothetical protein n=1 Tax=Vibrio vulnificus TaxID=672 RepID=UPI001A1D2AFF|nr:hypothetical protein [Vibrio vulnificus]MCG8706603.1 hypothetical protein [Vibrio vulnificus]HAS8156254.1 hypothetical protein [Vibrio vulnificus]
MNKYLKGILILLLVGGGFGGLLEIIVFSLSNTSSHPLVNFIFVIGFVILSFQIYAGMVLVFNDGKITPAIISLIMQIPIIWLPAFAYQFSSGFLIYIIHQSPIIQAGWHVGDYLVLHIGPNSPFKLGFGVNIIAATLLIILLITSMKSIREKKLNANAENI